MCTANIIISEKAKKVPPDECLKKEALHFIHKQEPKCCAISAYFLSHSIHIALAHCNDNISYYRIILKSKHGKVQYEIEGMEDGSKLPYLLSQGLGKTL